MILLPSGLSCRDLGVSLEDLKSFALCEIEWSRVSSVVCGMEPGWDQAVALTAIDSGIDVHLVIPNYERMGKWSLSQQKKCQVIIDAALIVENWGSSGSELDADRRLASLAEELVVLGQEGFNNVRISVSTHRRIPITQLWESWKMAGTVA